MMLTVVAEVLLDGLVVQLEQAVCALGDDNHGEAL